MGIVSYCYKDSLLRMEITSGPLQLGTDCNHKGIAYEGFLHLGAWQPYYMFSPQSEVCGMVKEGDPARVPYRLSQGFFTLLMFVKFVISVPEH